MIQLVKLTIAGFKSFQDPQTFPLDRGPGLYLLAGRNKIHPEKGGNSAGKTTVFDALCWNLYGRTLRGQKGPDVRNWEEAEPTRVTLEIKKDDILYTIRRSQSPNSLTLAKQDRPPKSVTQETIDALINLSYLAFTHSVLLGQFNRFFLDLSPNERLSLFSDILDLDYWPVQAEKAKERYKEMGQELRTQNEDRISLNAKISVTARSILEWVESEQSFRKDKDVRIDALQGWIHLKGLDLRRAKEGLEKAEEKVRMEEKELEVLRGRVTKLEDRQRERSYGLRMEEKELKKTEEGLKENPLVCSTCGQRIKDGEVRKGRLLAEQKELRLSVKKMGRVMGKGEEKLKVLKGEQRRMEEGLKELEKKKDSLKSNLLEEGLRLDTKREQLKTLQEGGNPYTAKRIKAERERDGLVEDLAALEKEIAETEVGSKDYKDLSILFRELRLWLIEEAVMNLQVEINNSLQQLGLNGWEVECVVEKETKQGSIQRGFHIDIRSPDSQQKKVRWESWSGGETQRLRIAAACGLQSLIQNRTGTHINLEVFDEPTTHLSEEGITDLLAFLRQRADEEQKQVWLIDHRSLSNGEFTGKAEVVLTRYGSRIGTGSWKKGDEIPSGLWDSQ